MAPNIWVFKFSCSTGVQAMVQMSAISKPGLTITLGTLSAMCPPQIALECWHFLPFFFLDWNLPVGSLSLFLCFRPDPHRIWWRPFLTIISLQVVFLFILVFEQNINTTVPNTRLNNCCLSGLLQVLVELPC
jgi:hypothetical protein